MVAMAKNANIKVVLGTIPPQGQSFLDKDPWRCDEIKRTNAWIRGFARYTPEVILVDYQAALQDKTNECLYAPGMTDDDMHPSQAAYAIITPLAQEAIKEAYNWN